MGRSLRKTDAKVLGWCMMSNHVHLVVRAGKEPLARLMGRVNSGYARWKNRKDSRIGPVFAGRYKAVLIEEENYLLELMRYIHLNPVRASVVKSPDESTWSSHGAYIGMSPAPKWLEMNAVLSLFGTQPDIAMRSFHEFVLDGISLKRSEILSGNQWMEYAAELRHRSNTTIPVSDFIVGSDGFIESTIRKLDPATPNVVLRDTDGKSRHRPPIDDLIDLICDVLNLDRLVFDESPKKKGPRYARQLLARIWVSHYRGTQLALARHIKVNQVLVSRWYSKAIENDEFLYDWYSTIVERLPEVEQYQVPYSGNTINKRHAPVRSTVNIELER